MAKRPRFFPSSPKGPRPQPETGPSIEALVQQALQHHERAQTEQARALYEQVLARQPLNFVALHQLGVLAMDADAPAQAATWFRQAMALQPQTPSTHYNLGNALRELRQPLEALACYDQALRLKPDHVKAWINRGNVLTHLQRHPEAVDSYDRALALQADAVDAWFNRGNALKALKRFEEALASYDQTLKLKPDFEFLPGIRLHLQMQLCDWKDFAARRTQLEQGIEQGLRVSPPFGVLALSDRSEIHARAAAIFARAKFPQSNALGPVSLRAPDGKIRLAYYSADFHNHATTHLMAELLESHDRQRFEVHGFSFGPDLQDSMRERVVRGLDHFHEVSGKSDREIAQWSRQLGIDVAVDLKGFTQDCRMGIFAERCAPIQVSYLGYPGTSATPYFDYIIADPVVIAPAERSLYSEKVIEMPRSYQVNDSKRPIAPQVFTREALGLPPDAWVFCCFNNSFKILPDTFDLWMRLLKRQVGSVLWLLEDNPLAARHLRREAQARGVDPERLVFAPRVKLDEHLARHQLADLFLDTWPYNAHTTASDALWAGVPVLTCMGHSFPSRVAASLLRALDLPELITSSPGHYEQRALELASNPREWMALRQKLAKNRRSASLFQGRDFARQVSLAYDAIYRRALAGLPPHHVRITAPT